MPFAGSSEPLHFTVLAFTGKDKPLVIADPATKPIWPPSLRSPVIKFAGRPRGAATHDIRAMLAAASRPV